VSFACIVIASDQSAAIDQLITKQDDPTGTHSYTFVIEMEVIFMDINFIN